MSKDLKKAWDMHTGDVSSGAHDTTWGATPLFVNNTVYVGTPKYRIFAVEPDTGKAEVDLCRQAAPTASRRIRA